MNYDVAIIGCGVTGAACAYALSRYQLNVLVLEADNDVANGTTKANSAIIHAGYDPKPGTKMARLNVLGNHLTGLLCEKLDVPFRRIGSLVIALDEEERSHLQLLFQQGTKSGVPGLRMLSAEEALAMEPNLNPELIAALYAPTAGIINPWEFALAMAETAVRNGTVLMLCAPVNAVKKEDGVFHLATPKGNFTASYVVNCAGTAADQVSQLICEKSYTVLPSKGEYYLLDKSEGSRVVHVIFQCPTRAGKGVLVAPTVHGNLIVGPSAEGCERDDTANTPIGMELVRQHALNSVPSIRFGENIRNFAGVRANTDHDDFIIGESSVPGFFEAAGIRSPGLTAAPAIGLEIVSLLQAAGLSLTEKSEFIDSRRRIRFNSLSAEEKERIIAQNPLYGRVICRCETVTEGEIVAAMHTPIPPVSVNGVKRRVGAGMGRCQGGFCGPRVQDILARELDVSQTEIPMDSQGTYILTGETKGGAFHEFL